MLTVLTLISITSDGVYEQRKRTDTLRVPACAASNFDGVRMYELQDRVPAVMKTGDEAERAHNSCPRLSDSQYARWPTWVAPIHMMRFVFLRH